MSKLLVISPYFYPDRGGGSAVNTDLCEGLSSRGFEVTVWTTYSHYPEWRDKLNMNGFSIREESHGNWRIVRFGLYIPRNPGSLFQRLAYEASFFLSVLRRLHKMREQDAVMAFCPLVSSVGIAALGALLFRKPLWLNVQDLAAEAAAAGGIMKKGLLSNFFKRIQSLLFNSASVWSSISPVMIERLKIVRARGQQIHYLPNWLNDSLAQEIAALGGKYGRKPSDPIRLLYAGNFGRKQNLIALLESFRCSAADFHMTLHGSGAELISIKNWFAAHHDARFTLGDFLDERGFAKAIYDCDVFVIPEVGGSGDSFLPSKLTAVMATGTPVLAVCDATSPLGCEVLESECGTILHWAQLGQISRQLEWMGEDPSRFKQWQINALNRSTFFCRNAVLDKFHAEIQSMIKKDGPGFHGA